MFPVAFCFISISKLKAEQLNTGVILDKVGFEREGIVVTGKKGENEIYTLTRKKF